MTKRIRESAIEAHLVNRVAQSGGVAEKFKSPNRSNVPDRLVQWPACKPYYASIQFVECKRPGERPTKAQARDHARRRAMGFVVEVVDSFESVDQFIERYAP